MSDPSMQYLALDSNINSDCYLGRVQPLEAMIRED